MSVRGLLAVAGVALIATACGGSRTPPRPAAIHLDGKHAQGDYVLETDASGAQFLVPATVLAGQGKQAFDVASPTGATPGEPSSAVTGVAPPFRVVIASATAVVPHSAHVEILATGESGRRFELSWVETCGWTQHGKAAVGARGGQGREVLRSPAVTLVKVPRIDGGVTSCYLAATAATGTFTRGLRLTIIDY